MRHRYKIVVFHGDGIGPEVCQVVVQVLKSSTARRPKATRSAFSDTRLGHAVASCEDRCTAASLARDDAARPELLENRPEVRQFSVA